MCALSGNSPDKNTGVDRTRDVDWVAGWVRDYYASAGLSGESLETAVKNALDGMRDLTKTPAIFRVKVTAERFRISPYNARYVRNADLAAVAEEIDEKTRRSLASGQIHPILVKPAEEPGTWYIMAGVRRAAALMGRYTLMRVYIPSDAREEAMLSLEENLVRKGFTSISLLTVAERSEELGVYGEFRDLLDERDRLRLEAVRSAGRVEEERQRYDDFLTPTAPSAAKASENRKNYADRAVYEPVTRLEKPSDNIERCPNCGEPLRVVCSRCGAPV